ncbi:MAG TPA: hypothetical protein VEI06_17570 [Gemmatimonadaceae bacterium]|nr:hypothetical protein [Gemmatimonadaceae bacterium]
MHRKIITMVGALALAGAVTGLSVTRLSAASSRTDEPHPAIHAAIDALVQARFDLKHAAHDFGGHRVAALQATDEAIAQLKLALQYDK